MNKENTKRKGIGWFKVSNDNNNQDNLDRHILDTEHAKEEHLLNSNEAIEQHAQNNNNLFSKDTQDKIVLDLIVSLENMVKDRQLTLYKNKDLSNQLFFANEAISRVKQDLVKKEQLLQEKIKEIRVLENNLTSKQMSYDQLLEDYKEFQNNSNMEYEKISSRLEAEINKYNKLNEESINTQYQNMLKINELEENVRILKIDNEQYAQKNQSILDEKAELIQYINDFTEKMSFSFAPKTNTSDSK